MSVNTVPPRPTANIQATPNGNADSVLPNTAPTQGLRRQANSTKHLPSTSLQEREIRLEDSVSRHVQQDTTYNYEPVDAIILKAEHAQLYADNSTTVRIGFHIKILRELKEAKKDPSRGETNAVIITLNKELKKIPHPNLPPPPTSSDYLSEGAFSTGFYQRVDRSQHFLQYVNNSEKSTTKSRSKFKFWKKQSTAPNKNDPKLMKNCYVKSSKELSSMIKVYENKVANASPEEVSKKDQELADKALQSFLLKEAIIKNDDPQNVTMSLPDNFKNISDENENPLLTKSACIQAFNLSLCPLSSLLETTQLGLKALDKDISRPDLETKLVDSGSLINIKNFMLGKKKKSEQRSVSGGLLRKIVTKTSGLARNLDEEDKKVLDSLLRGPKAKVGGVDFCDHGDLKTKKFPDDFVYTPKIMNELQTHILKLAIEVERLNNKFGTSVEFR